MTVAGNVNNRQTHRFYQSVEKLGIGSLFKNDEMQGARISRSEAYIAYVAPTRNEAQRRRSRFSTGCYATGSDLGGSVA